MNYTVLDHVQEFNDLGMDRHVSSACAKANERQGYIRCNLGNTCDYNIKLLCYKSLVWVIALVHWK